MNGAEFFSDTYHQARQRFIEAARARGVKVDSRINPRSKGAQDEDLAMDVAFVGPPDASKLLIASSGTHGVEGLCGTGCQLALLHDDIMMDLAAQRGVALLLIHAVEPYGFSHCSRTNEDNIDLNRNFRDFSEPLRPNPMYEAIHSLYVPLAWPPTEVNENALKAQTSAFSDLERRSVNGGQDQFPGGLFYSGTAPTWSNVTVRDVLRTYAASRQSIAWIDLHTGIGPYGHGEKIFGAHDAQTTARAQRWWGLDLIQSTDPNSISPRTVGHITSCAPFECPSSRITPMTLEYGTVPTPQVRYGLRAAAWLRAHPEASSEQKEAIRRLVRDVFYVDRDDWKGMILAQFRAVAIQTLNGLGEEG